MRGAIASLDDDDDDDDVTVTVTICGDACPLSCASAEAYTLAQCTRLQGWGS